MPKAANSALTASEPDQTALAKASPKVIGKPFEKGMSGNPNGRPKLPAELKTAMEAATADAFADLVKLSKTAKSEAVRAKCLDSILDRGLGRAAQAITGLDGGPIQVAALVVLPALREPEDE